MNQEKSTCLISRKIEIKIVLQLFHHHRILLVSTIYEVTTTFQNVSPVFLRLSIQFCIAKLPLPKMHSFSVPSHNNMQYCKIQFNSSQQTVTAVSSVIPPIRWRSLPWALPSRDFPMKTSL